MAERPRLTRLYRASTCRGGLGTTVRTAYVCLCDRGPSAGACCPTGTVWVLLGVAKDSTLKAALFILFFGGFTPKPSVPIGQFLGPPLARAPLHSTQGAHCERPPTRRVLRSQVLSPVRTADQFRTQIPYPVPSNAQRAPVLRCFWCIRPASHFASALACSLVVQVAWPFPSTLDAPIRCPIHVEGNYFSMVCK